MRSCVPKSSSPSHVPGIAGTYSTAKKPFGLSSPINWNDDAPFPIPLRLSVLLEYTRSRLFMQENRFICYLYSYWSTYVLCRECGYVSHCAMPLIRAVRSATLCPHAAATYGSVGSSPEALSRRPPAFSPRLLRGEVHKHGARPGHFQVPLRYSQPVGIEASFDGSVAKAGHHRAWRVKRRGK
jgi:hypothetical protein